MISENELNNWFDWHAPTENQAERCVTIGNAGKVLAEVILSNTLPSASQTAAIRKIREAVMMANAFIVSEDSMCCGGGCCCDNNCCSS